MPLQGETVVLREERDEDLPLLVEWRNDLETQAWSKTLPPDYTADMYRKRHESREFSFDRTEGRFIITLRDSGEAVGSISYNWLEARLGVTIGLIVDRGAWGTGVAWEAQELLLRFLFQELGVRVVRLWTHSGNERAVALAQKAGFRVSMRQRESVFKGGHRYDNLSMDMLREEYFAARSGITDRMPSPEG